MMQSKPLENSLEIPDRIDSITTLEDIGQRSFGAHGDEIVLPPGREKLNCVENRARFMRAPHWMKNNNFGSSGVMQSFFDFEPHMTKNDHTGCVTAAKKSTDSEQKTDAEHDASGFAIVEFEHVISPFYFLPP